MSRPEVVLGMPVWKPVWVVPVKVWMWEWCGMAPRTLPLAGKSDWEVVSPEELRPVVKVIELSTEELVSITPVALTDGAIWIF